MLLKNVYQWDICNQEDLDIFSAESLEIDQSAARTLYRTDPKPTPTRAGRGRKNWPGVNGRTTASGSRRGGNPTRLPNSGRNG